MSRAAAPTPQNVRPDDRPRGVETRPGGLAEREAPHGGFANRIRLWKLRQLRPACRRTTTTGSELSTRARGGTGARARSSARCSATGSVPVCGCWTRGCGPGGHLRWAADSGFFKTIAGVDLGRQAIEIARTRVPDAVLEVAPLHELPFTSHSFDLVVTHDVLQHIPEEDSRSLAELGRVLDPAGALVVRTNGARRSRRVRRDWRVYDRSALRATLESAGFRCERLTYANMLPSLAAAVRGRTPQAPTESRAGVPPRDASRVRARAASGLAYRGLVPREPRPLASLRPQPRAVAVPPV